MTWFSKESASLYLWGRAKSHYTYKWMKEVKSEQLGAKSLSARAEMTGQVLWLLPPSMVLGTGFIYRQSRQCSKHFLKIQPGKYCRGFLRKHYRTNSVKIWPRKGHTFPGGPPGLGKTLVSHAHCPFKGRHPLTARCGFPASCCCFCVLQSSYLISLVACLFPSLLIIISSGNILSPWPPGHS